MNSNKIVTKEDILNSIMRLRQRGNQPIMEDLEHREPELTEHLLEELTLIHTKLGTLGMSPKSQRQLHRRIEALMLVLILAMESAHARLWADVGC